MAYIQLSNSLYAWPAPQVGYMLVGMKDTRQGEPHLSTLMFAWRLAGHVNSARLLSFHCNQLHPPTAAALMVAMCIPCARMHFLNLVLSGCPATPAARVGDTWHHYRRPVEPLPGFKPAKSMVFAGQCWLVWCVYPTISVGCSIAWAAETTDAYRIQQLLSRTACPSCEWSAVLFLPSVPCRHLPALGGRL